MGSDQQYNLKWNDFHSSFASSFNSLRNDSDFVDVTLASEGRSFIAHRLVLSACSAFLKKLLKANPCQHPIIILKDVKPAILDSLLHFMYNGSVDISQSLLGEFLKAAQNLEVKGLSDDSNINDNVLSGPSTIIPSVNQPYHEQNKRLKTRHLPEMTPQVINSQTIGLENDVEQGTLSSTYHSPQLPDNPFPQINSDTPPLYSAEQKNVSALTSVSDDEKNNEQIIFKQEPTDITDKPNDGGSFSGGTASVMNTELDNGSNSGQDPSNDNSMDFNNGNSGLIPRKLQGFPIRCEECFKTFSANNSLHQHMLNVHAYIPKVDWIKCLVCDKSFKTRQLWSMHIRRAHGIVRRAKKSVGPKSNNSARYF